MARPTGMLSYKIIIEDIPLIVMNDVPVGIPHGCKYLQVLVTTFRKSIDGDEETFRLSSETLRWIQQEISSMCLLCTIGEEIKGGMSSGEVSYTVDGFSMPVAIIALDADKVEECTRIAKEKILEKIREILLTID